MSLERTELGGWVDGDWGNIEVRGMRVAAVWLNSVLKSSLGL